MSFLVKLLFEYSFIFLSTYLIIHIVINKNIERNQAWIFGFLFAIQLIFILSAQNVLRWEGLPDGRYVLLGLSVFFWGYYTAIPLVFVITGYNLLFYPDYLFLSLVIALTTILVFHLYRRWLDKKVQFLKWYHMILNGIIPTLISMPLSILFFPDEGPTIMAQSKVYIILPNVILLTYLVFYANNRELQRNYFIRDLRDAKEELLQQNEEIHALYEEISASEETLQENYDELSAYKTKLEFLAYHNVKTGLYNKKFLLEQMNQYISNKEGHVLFYIKAHDLNHYSETLGHNLSDVLHAHIAKVITKHIEGHGNIMVFDLFNGQYAFIIRKYNKRQMNRIISSVNKDLSKVTLLENMTLSMSIDVGAVELNLESKPSITLEYAETAMHESSKYSDQIITWFSHEMYQEKRYLSRLEIDLQHAIENNELFIVYQPQYNPRGQIIGAEALLRWQHPEYGLISPAVFIPLAERMGSINKIGHYVIRKCFKILADLKSEYFSNIPIAINASFLELINPEYASMVKDNIKAYKIDPKLVHIEITETAFSNDSNIVIKNMLSLVDKQIDFHLDDFGTGYSSMSYLSQFPVKVIKIDKSFIDLILENNKIHHVVAAIIDLAHRLGMKVVAEGVEIKEQIEILDSFKCDYYQGYFFSKPISENAFKALLKDQKT